MSDILAKPSSYIDYLPAIYREGETRAKANHVGRFLKIFEKLLSGIDDEIKLEHEKKVIGIEEIIEVIHDYFDPLFTPSISKDEQNILDFISYLSSWVALVQNQTWDQKSQRKLLNSIVPLYKKRGTESGLSQYLKIYLREFTNAEVTIQEYLLGIQVGVEGRATIGRETVVGGAPPHFFFIKISQDILEGYSKFRNLVANTRAIIDLEKPAHTHYAILYDVPGMVVGIRSKIGDDTLIGTSLGVFL